MPWAIETYALTKRFPQPRGWLAVLTRPAPAAPAVNQVTLAVHEGERFGLLGPNGAGKTTLIKLLSTLILPSQGTAQVAGYPLDRGDEIKRAIGLANSDERSFFWRLSGRQNLEFFAILHGLPGEEVSERIQTTLAQVGLKEAADQVFQTYSTGMRQRLSIARALLHRPRLLFLDEPSKGLDPAATRQLHSLVRRLCQESGLTIFMTTHDLQEAEELCERVAVMNRGRIQACGSVAELRELLPRGERYVFQVCGLSPALQANLKARLPQLRITSPEGPTALQNGTAAVEIETQEGDSALNTTLDLLREGQATIQRIQHETVSLEQIFVHLVAQVEPNLARLPEELQEPAPRRSELPPAIPLPTRSIAHALRVAAAFLQRDLRTEASYRFAFVLQFLEILFSVSVFYFIAQVLGPNAAPYLALYGGDYFSFILIGIAFVGYFGVGLTSFSSRLRQAQTTGTLEAMLTTPTGLSTLIFSASLWDYLMTTLRALIYLAVGGIFLGVSLEGSNVPAALLVLLLTVVVFSSLGVLAASFIMVLKRGDPITWMFSAASNLFGGVYFPTAVLPPWLHWITALLPITYALDAMRQALLQSAPFSSLLPDILALGLFGLLLLPLSILAFRFAVRRARQDGSLTQY